MRADFTFEMPPGRIASSTSATRRVASPPPSCRKRSRRRRKATSRLRSLVVCESTVSTSSAIGWPCGRHQRDPVDLAQRASRTRARARASAASTCRPAGSPASPCHRRHPSGPRAVAGDTTTLGHSASCLHRSRSVPHGPMIVRRCPRQRPRATIGTMPVFWREAPAPASGAPPAALPARRADQLRRLAPVPGAHRRPRARPARLRALRQARLPRLHDRRATPTSSSASSTSSGVERVSLRRARLGRRSGSRSRSATPSASSGWS